MKKIFFLLSLLLISIAVNGADPRFIYSRGPIIPERSTLMVCDLNQDSYPDILVNDSENILWWENNGKGKFKKSHEIEELLNVSMARAVKAGSDHDFSLHINSLADMDADGDPDIVFYEPHSKELLWFENDGRGSFRKYTVIDTLEYKANQVIVSDFNRDGYTDILLIYDNDLLYLGNSDITKGFSKRVLAEFTHSDTRGSILSCHVMDFDRDSDPDLLLRFSGEKLQFILLRNNEDFKSFTMINKRLFHTERLRSATDLLDDQRSEYTEDDYSSDHVIDSIVEDTAPVIMESAADLIDDQRSEYTEEYYSFYHAKDTFVDFDGDAEPDIFLYQSGRLAFVELKISSDIPDTVWEYGELGGTRGTFAFDDIDGDHEAEVFFFAEREGKLNWADSDFGEKRFYQHAVDGFIGHPGKISILFSDIDSDGDRDILANQWESEKYFFYERTADLSGRFKEPVIIHNKTKTGQLAAMIDMNGDGTKDLLYHNENCYNNNNSGYSSNAFYIVTHIDTRSGFLRFITFYPVLAILIFSLSFAALMIIIQAIGPKDNSDERGMRIFSLFFSPPLAIVLCLLPLFSNYSIWWLILGMILVGAAIMSFIEEVRKISLKGGGLSLVIFRTGTSQPSDPEKYFREIAGKYYRNFSLNSHYVVGYSKKLSKVDARNLYNKLIAEGKLPVLGEIARVCKGKGTDEKAFTVVFFHTPPVPEEKLGQEVVLSETVEKEKSVISAETGFVTSAGEVTKPTHKAADQDRSSALVEIRTYEEGKLYLTREISGPCMFTLADRKGNSHNILFGEANWLNIFTDASKTNLQNQLAFIRKCKTAGLLPDVTQGVLSAVESSGSAQQIQFITGSFQAMIQYQQMFYLPEAEAVFNALFPSGDWNMMNSEKAEINFAVKGYSLNDTFNSYDNLIRDIRNGVYVLEEIIHKPGKIK
ncbi:MAG: VCBS repeat-containing protein [Bacteroidales bacterium]|nr:VCBS repeat-containing protein [Bacteroidales bacterium]MBN2763761.1 VCBS repeat-containing protein [Bacteroidales bacterium]